MFATRGTTTTTTPPGQVPVPAPATEAAPALHQPRLDPVVVVVQHLVEEVVEQVAVQAVAVVALQVE